MKNNKQFVYLDDHELNMLNYMAKKLSISKSEVLRRAMRELYLALVGKK